MFTFRHGPPGPIPSPPPPPPPPDYGIPIVDSLTKDDIIDALRLRLRRSQGERFKVEAQLAIVTGERDCLAKRLKKLMEECRGLFSE